MRNRFDVPGTTIQSITAMLALVGATIVTARTSRGLLCYTGHIARPEQYAAVAFLPPLFTLVLGLLGAWGRARLSASSSVARQVISAGSLPTKRRSGAR